MKRALLIGIACSVISMTGTVLAQLQGDDDFALLGASGGTGSITAGTTNRIPKYTSGASSVLGNSGISDDGTTISTAENISLTGRFVQVQPDAAAADSVSSFGGGSGGTLHLYTKLYTGNTALQNSARIILGSAAAAQGNSTFRVESPNGVVVLMTIDSFLVSTVLLTSLKANTYLTTTDCTDSAGAAACGAAAAGSVVIDDGATTVVVTTTAMGTNSEPSITFDSSLGTKLGVTCNTTYTDLYVSARGTSTFTVTATADPATANPICLNYRLTN